MEGPKKGKKIKYDEAVKGYNPQEMKQHHDEIVDTDGFGERSYQRMQESINASRKCTLNQFIAGLGIPMVGRSAGRILNKHFGGDWNAFEDAIKS